MRASSITSSAIFASLSLAEVLAPSPAISDPTITPAPNVPVELLRKQNNDRFMGWVKISGTWTSRTCDIGGTYYQSGSNWRCCATTVAGCQGPVGCVSGSLVYSVTTGSQSRATYAWYGELYKDESKADIENPAPMSTPLLKISPSRYATLDLCTKIQRTPAP